MIKYDNNTKYVFIGDIHSCYDVLVKLLTKIGVEVENSKLRYTEKFKERKIVFTGDLIDRGPKPVEVLRLAMKLCNDGKALAVLGNHDDKLRRALLGNNVKLNHGLDFTLENVLSEGEEFAKKVLEFLSECPHQYILDDGKVIVAHGGLHEDLHEIDTNRMKKFALYGDITGKFDEKNYPIRRDWAKEYEGKRLVVYGHTIIEDTTLTNNTINLDTGCFKTGILSGLLYPELEIVQIMINKSDEKN